MDYRDTLNILDTQGKNKKMYPKQVNGTLYKLRNIFGWLLLAFLFTAPFVKIGGQPLLLFNIIERKFIIFGQIFFPQDFPIFALAMLTFIVFIALFTVVFGRVFCGWACPQTIFMELIFRKIENLIEGDANQQRKLDAAEWTNEKIFKKTLKHTIFIAISFVIANIFLAYLVGVEALQQLITHSPLHHVRLFISLVVFTMVFYYVFAKFRELVCIIVCPYGRLQSVLLDKKSIVVAYDFVRGEPRGKLQKDNSAATLSKQANNNQSKNNQTKITTEENTPKGDCIDCKLCVQVCPTGIDIRNGTQLECINCTACIDVCDEVMLKIDKPTKLIRYDSMQGIAEKIPLRFNSRIVAYSVVLVALMGLLSYFLLSRKPVEITILRTPGMLYQQPDSLTISNLYNLELVNKTNEKTEITLKIKEDIGIIKFVSQEKTLTLQGQEIFKTSFFIYIPKNKIQKMNTKLYIQAYRHGELMSETKTSFAAPN
jgi:cytochrome c oxidase accessory protein FixG